MSRARSRGRKAKRRVSLPSSGYDQGTPERAERNGGLVSEARDVTAGGVAVGSGKRAAIECKLDWYRRHRWIDERQFAAGMKLREIADRAALEKSVIAAYRPRVPTGPIEPDATMVARQYLNGLTRLLGEDHWLVLMDVCAYDENAGADRMGTLRDGLDALARHWRLDG